MAGFVPSYKEARDFNNGEKVRDHIDSPSATDFNNVIENVLVLNEDSIFLHDNVAVRLQNAEENIRSFDGKLDEVSETITKDFSETKKKVENLYARTFPEIDVIDNAVAYSKTVPNGALPYAEVAKVGGMSHKSDNLAMPNKETLVTNGFVCTVDANKRLVVTGSATTAEATVIDFVATYANGARERIPLLAGEEYSWYVYKNGVSLAEFGDGVNFQIEYTDAQGGTVWSWGGQDTSRPRDLVRMYLQKNVVVGDTSLCGTYEVMFNKGSTALPYSPYFDGLRHAKVTAVKSEIPNLFTSDGFLYETTDGGNPSGVHRALSAAIPLKGGMKIRAKNNTKNSKYSFEFQLYNGLSSLKYLSGWLSDDEIYRIPYPEEVGATELRVLVGGDSFNNAVTKDVIDSLGIEVFEGENPPRELGLLEIPEAIQNLDGYGVGASAVANNHVDFEAKKYRKCCGVAKLSEYSFAFGDTMCYSTQFRGKPLGESLVNIPASINYCFLNGEGLLVFRYDSGKFANVSEFMEAIKNSVAVYELPEAYETDVSHIIPADDFILVEAGGQIVAENEYKLGAPTTINYQIN